MLARLGTRYVIVGHSERRTLFGMDDATVAATLRAVLRHEMTPIVCVGETEEQRGRGPDRDRARGAGAGGPEGLAPDVLAGLVVAYEPLWAIGTGTGGHRDGRRGRLRLHPVPGGEARRATRRRRASGSSTGAR